MNTKFWSFARHLPQGLCDGCLSAPGKQPLLLLWSLNCSRKKSKLESTAHRRHASFSLRSEKERSSLGSWHLGSQRDQTMISPTLAPHGTPNCPLHLGTTRDGDFELQGKPVVLIWILWQHRLFFFFFFSSGWWWVILSVVGVMDCLSKTFVKPYLHYIFIS